MRLSFSSLLAVTSLGTAAAFQPYGILTKLPSTTKLFAEGGAPQYNKNEAILESVENVGKGNYLLSVKYKEDYGEEAKYEPGNVLALEIRPPADADAMKASPNSIDEYTTINEKTEKDTNNNEGWLRGPYTVSRGLDNGFQVLIKQVGYKSNVMATAAPNTPVRFGGKFKVPIVEGILNSLDVEGKTTERVVLVSTGVGIGPCVGSVELLLGDKDSKFQGKIDLLASFRTQEEVSLAGDLEKLSSEYSERFTFMPIITGEVGRLAKSPESLVALLKSDTCAVQNTHYHLIGNGRLVNEWKAGLEKAGVPKERVTLEAYFNHVAEADASAVENIASTVKKLQLREAELAR